MLPDWNRGYFPAAGSALFNVQEGDRPALILTGDESADSVARPGQVEEIPEPLADRWRHDLVARRQA